MAKSPAGKEEEGTAAQKTSASSSSNSEQRTNERLYEVKTKIQVQVLRNVFSEGLG